MYAMFVKEMQCSEMSGIVSARGVCQSQFTLEGSWCTMAESRVTATVATVHVGNGM